MEKLITRILIAYTEGAEIAYIYNREAFDLLNIEKQTWDKSQFLEKGNIFTYDGKKYKIKEINYKLYKEMSEVDNSVGINMYSPTDLSDYNCQIGVFVEDVE